MKKVVETVYCDDCGKEVNLQLYQTVAGFDLCSICLNRRVKHSHKISSIGKKCESCLGKGQHKEFYGHNDYNLEKCSECNGSGRIFPNV
jgi:DnaJ-class molecular chaperone